MSIAKRFFSPVVYAVAFVAILIAFDAQPRLMLITAAVAAGVSAFALYDPEIAVLFTLAIAGAVLVVLTARGSPGRLDIALYGMAALVAAGRAVFIWYEPSSPTDPEQSENAMCQMTDLKHLQPEVPVVVAMAVAVGSSEPQPLQSVLADMPLVPPSPKCKQCGGEIETDGNWRRCKKCNRCE